jgi:molybdopterin-binding protein
MFFKPTTLVTGTILSLVFYGLSTSSVLARPTSDRSANRIDNRHGILVSQENAEPAGAAESTDPQAATVPSNKVVGIVKSYNNNTLELRDVTGGSQPYTLKSNAVGSLNLRQGMMVSLDTDQEGAVSAVEMAEIDQSYTGVITGINEETVTLQLPDGQTTTTIIAPETAARMGLSRGVPLKVTTFRGTTATKVCIGQRPAPVVEAPPPLPTGGFEPIPQEVPPPLPERPRALW